MFILNPSAYLQLQILEWKIIKTKLLIWSKVKIFFSNVVNIEAQGTKYKLTKIWNSGNIMQDRPNFSELHSAEKLNLPSPFFSINKSITIYS